MSTMSYAWHSFCYWCHTQRLSQIQVTGSNLNRGFFFLDIIECKYLADASAGVFSVSDLHCSSLWFNSPLNSSHVWKKWPQASSSSQRPCNLRPQREEVPLSKAHVNFWEITMSLSHVFVLTESKRWALGWQLRWHAHGGRQGVLGPEVLVLNLVGNLLFK